MDEIELLRRVDIFHKLDRAELELLRSQMHKESLKTDQVVEPKALWLILEGQAEWVVKDCADQQLVLQRLQPGDHFGELALVVAEPGGQSRVKVREDLTALRLEREAFRQFIESRPQALFQALQAVAGRLHHLDDSLRASVSRNVYEDNLVTPGWGQKVADFFTARMGSWPFIQFQSLCLVAWMIWNVVSGTEHWDPYPFIFLNLALSFQSAYAAPIIMMSQNRQSEKDRLAAEIDHQVNLQAERTSALVLSRLSRLEQALLTGERNSGP